MKKILSLLGLFAVLTMTAPVMAAPGGPGGPHGGPVGPRGHHGGPAMHSPHHMPPHRGHYITPHHHMQYSYRSFPRRGCGFYAYDSMYPLGYYDYYYYSRPYVPYRPASGIGFYIGL